MARSQPRPAVTAWSPRHAGWFAAALYALGGTYLAATANELPATSRDRIWVGAVTALLTGLVLVALPWDRMPPWSTLGPPLWAFLVLAFPIGWYAHALSHFLPLYTLLFSYVGLTQRRGTCLAMLPLGLLALLPAWWETPRLSTTFLVGPVVVAAVLGEVLAVLSHEQQRSRANLAALLDASTQLQSAPDITTAADVIAHLTHELFGADLCVVMLRESRGSATLVNANTAHSSVPPGTVTIDSTAPGSACGRALSDGAPLWVPDVEADPTLTSPIWSQLQHRAALFVPLGAAGSFEGVASVQFAQPRKRVDQAAQRSAQVLAVQSGLVLRRLRETQELTDLVTTDPLTGLANRRAFFAQLAELRPGDALAFVDLDHFKAINDEHGHQHGDGVLRAFGDALLSLLRSEDLASRYGGEEFALLLPETGASGARQLLERFRATWAADHAGITFSAGIAQHVGGSPTITLGAADAALYDAKRAGRDRIQVARQVPVPRRRTSSPTSYRGADGGPHEGSSLDV